MYQLHNWVNGAPPAINASNLNDMDLGIASGCTYMATCNSAADSIAKAITITNFASSRLLASPGVPFVLYVMFANGSSSETMTIAINGGSSKTVKYRNSSLNINALSINANDVVAFIFDGTSYNLLGAISAPLLLLDVAHGGTGRNSLTANAIIAGNGTGQVQMITPSVGALIATSQNDLASFDIVPVSLGGTGSTSAASARTSLGIPTVYTGTGTPSSSTGSNGDIYFKYTA